MKILTFPDIYLNFCDNSWEKERKKNITWRYHNGRYVRPNSSFSPSFSFFNNPIFARHQGNRMIEISEMRRMRRPIIVHCSVERM